MRHLTEMERAYPHGSADPDVRWVYLYLIKEYAWHLGHADLLWERIDGATGEWAGPASGREG